MRILTAPYGGFLVFNWTLMGDLLTGLILEEYRYGLEKPHPIRA
jgi:hypothetical protein